MGAPVLATLVAINKGEQVAIDFGRNAKGNISLQISTPGGDSVVARLPYEPGLASSGLVALKKSGIYRQTLVLNEWYNGFDDAGEYSIDVVVEGDLEWPCNRSASAIIRIAPYDPERMKEVCTSLEKRALQADAEVSMKAARALTFVSQEECLPHLARVLKNSFHSRAAAAHALARIGTEKAIQALVEGWDGLLAGERARVLAGMDEKQRKVLAAALALAGKRLMPEDPWN